MNRDHIEAYRASVAGLGHDGVMAEIERLHTEKRANDRRMREMDTELGREMVERLRGRLADVLEGYGRIRLKGKDAAEAVMEVSAKQQEEFFVRRELEFYEGVKKVDETLDAQLMVCNDILKSKGIATTRRG